MSIVVVVILVVVMEIVVIHVIVVDVVVWPSTGDLVSVNTRANVATSTDEILAGTVPL